jgi:carbon monoxide dehydrogenase subunit G
MEIKNEFEVPLDPSTTWKVLLDIKRIIPCVPGAELVEIIDESTYKGKIAVKLGPVGLSFLGTAQFVERNEAERTAKVKGKGSDTKGRGSASADVGFHIEPSGSGSKVYVNTNVNLSGAVAQYGRGAGIIQSVASQLTKQFAENLRASLQGEKTQVSLDSEPKTMTGANSQSIAAAKPISGLSLMFKVFLSTIAGLFSRKKQA